MHESAICGQISVKEYHYYTSGKTGSQRILNSLHCVNLNHLISENVGLN